MPKKAKRGQSPQMHCPYCGARMKVRAGAEIYHDDSNRDLLLVCVNYPGCNTYVRMHPGSTRPMGTPANGGLRNLRHRAHKSFDVLWKQGFMSRDAAYRWMADLLGLRLQDAHIGMLSPYHCQVVIDKCDELRARRAREAS